MGIADCTDPCQANQGACAAMVPGIPALPIGTSTNLLGLNPITGVTQPSPLLPSVASLQSSITSSGLASALPWLLGVAVAFGLLAAMGGRR